MYFKEHFKNSNKVLQIAIKYFFHDYTASPKHLGGWEKFWDCILGLHIGLEFTKPPLSLDEAMWTWKSALLPWSLQKKLMLRGPGSSNNVAEYSGIYVITMIATISGE